MGDRQDISSLKKYSADNLSRLQEMAGSLALEILPDLMTRHADIFRMDFFHETSCENISSIKKSRAVYSFDELKRRGKQNKSGMTIEERSTSDIFNNVSHCADSFTDYVYGRPVFGDLQIRNFGITWPDKKITDDMWFSFEDPNQLTFADNELIEWGMTVIKGFSRYDAYVGQDFTEAVALRALNNIAQIEYLGRLKKNRYDRQEALHISDSKYSEPDAKDNMSFESAMKYYEGIVLQPDAAYRAYDNAIWGYSPDDERPKELKEARLELSYGQSPAITQSIVDHKSFDQYFIDSCRAIFREVASHGQVAVSKALGTKKAVFPKAVVKRTTDLNPK